MLETYRHDARRFDLVIGVNRAVLAVPCDVWCFLDWHVWLDYRPPAEEGVPAILTTRCCQSHLARKGQGEALARNIRAFVDDIDAVPVNACNWRTYSAQAAMAYAYQCGATVIEGFGMDLHGVADYDGHESDKNGRTARRWTAERVIMTDLANWLNDHGCAFIRHGGAACSTG